VQCSRSPIASAEECLQSTEPVRDLSSSTDIGFELTNPQRKGVFEVRKESASPPLDIISTRAREVTRITIYVHAYDPERDVLLENWKY
jgi:hypothetical protein